MRALVLSPYPPYPPRGGGALRIYHLLRALADCIPPDEKLATIEMERELYLHKNPAKHPLVIAFEYRPGEGEPGASHDPTIAGHPTEPIGSLPIPTEAIDAEADGHGHRAWRSAGRSSAAG